MFFCKPLGDHKAKIYNRLTKNTFTRNQNTLLEKITRLPSETVKEVIKRKQLPEKKIQKKNQYGIIKKSYINDFTEKLKNSSIRRHRLTQWIKRTRRA